MTQLEFLKQLHEDIYFHTKEGSRCGKASGSELKRWFLNKAVIVNGVAVRFDEEVKEINSYVLFPKHRITLY